MCPVCESEKIKRIFSGCLFSPKRTSRHNIQQENIGFSDFILGLSNYVKSTFEDKGCNFTDTARQMHYGLQERKNIYGRSSTDEIKELIEEGISVIPLPDIKETTN